MRVPAPSYAAVSSRTINRLAWALCLSLLLWLCWPDNCRASPPALALSDQPLTAACMAADGSNGVVRDAPLVLAQPAGATFQADYNRVDWSGHFGRSVLAMLNGGVSAGPPLWDAGAILTGSATQAARPSPAQRKIYTLNTGAGSSPAMVDFLWAELSDAQRDLLNQTPPATPASKKKTDNLGPQRLDFLRGDRSEEGLLFRRRTSVLGDSVNSAPVYVGVASAAVQGAGYDAFYARSQARRPAVYLGANDGMLHAFDVADGTELFAYVPNMLIATLNQLTSPAYVHRAYVDGPAYAAEAQLNGDWRTVLVSGLGNGAQGVFALDVSDPLQFAAGGGALWEFSDADDPMMGNVTALPQFAKLAVHSNGGAAGYRYFAVVASGVNNYVDDGHRTAAGNGALFLLALDKPASEPWQLNVNYYRLITPIGDAALANGLSTPALVNGDDGTLRFAYAGDLQGDLWRFDFSGSAPWSNGVGPGAGKTPLFIARDANGVRQPITEQPKVAYASGGGLLILFGTGQLLTSADRQSATFAPQSFYAILDRLQSPAVVLSSRRQLAQRTLNGAAGDGSLSLSGAEMAAGDLGWYFDFPYAAQTGERSISSAQLSGGQLFFNTVLPGADACAAPASRSYVVDVLSGLSKRTSLTGILQTNVISSAPVLWPMSVSSAQRDPAGLVMQTRSVAVVNFGMAGAARAMPVATATTVVPAGRLSWREVANWRELHEAAIK